MPHRGNTAYTAGVASTIITPERPLPMHGFSSRGERPFTGVYQDLLMKVLALSDGRNRLAIVAADLGLWTERMVREIREKLRRRLRLAPRSILLNASHTHCGPSLRDEKPREAAYVNWVIDKAVDLVERAFSQRIPVRIRFARGHCDMASSRRCRDRNGYFVRGINPYGPIDAEVGLLTATRSSGKPLAVLFNYACHPTSMGGFEIGGDWAGFAQRFVEERIPGATAIFLQGCGGDLKVPNRHKNDPYRFGYDGGPAEASRWGRRLADAVIEGLDGPDEELHGPINSRLALVDLPLMDMIRDTDPEAAPFQAPHRRMARLAKSLLRSLDENGNYKKTLKCEVQVVRIGRDFVLVALNGEMAVRIGLRIKDQLIPRPVIVAAYCNARWSEIGYVPSLDMIPEEGYEAYTPYSLEMEDYLVSAVMAMAGRGRKRPRDRSAPRRIHNSSWIRLPNGAIVPKGTDPPQPT